jgi:nucleoside-diphosphate-sugar epimerase
VAANVELTSLWLAAARFQGVDKFLHISTAFSAGSNNEGFIREELHPEPEYESTVYTKTKRKAERLVSESGIPFVILRPSILVGDSSDGHYGGKPYGVYQFWKCAERLLSDRWRPHLHVVAPQQPIHVLHQDHLMKVFVAVFNHAPSDSIINVVSEDEVLPSCRDVWNLYSAQCLAPDSVTFYDSMQEVPLSQIDPRNRAFLKAISANVVINSLRWRFDTTHLQRFCGMGYETPRATLESLSACQRRFVANSSALTHFMRNHSSRFSAPTACLSQPGGL